MGPCNLIFFTVISVIIFHVLGCKQAHVDRRNLEKDNILLPDNKDIKPWPVEGQSQNPEKQKLDKIQRYLDRVACLFSKTEGVLKDLKSTIEHDSSASVNDIGKNEAGRAYHKISFVRPYFRSLLKANSRSILGSMMKKLMSSRRVA